MNACSFFATSAWSSGLIEVNQVRRAISGGGYPEGTRYKHVKKEGTGVETLTSVFTQAHRHSDNLSRHLIHYTRLSCSRRIYDACMSCINSSVFGKVVRDGPNKYVRRVALESEMPCIYTGCDQKRWTKYTVALRTISHRFRRPRRASTLVEWDLQNSCLKTRLEIERDQSTWGRNKGKMYRFEVDLAKIPSLQYLSVSW